jgi:DNA-binding response OmpR family regulator
MFTILVADDNPEIREVLEVYLREAGFAVLTAADGKQALEALEGGGVHLVLMDIMMPVLDGMSATQAIRRDSNIPIIFLSAKSQDDDKIGGLAAGADDYITKPFKPAEVLARVKAQLRRYTELGAADAGGHVLVVRGLTVNTRGMTVSVNGEEVRLTPTEFKILALLCKNRGVVLPVERIYESVWRQPFLRSESTVMFHISKLREKIERDPKNPMYIKVVWGRGYMVE